MVVYNIMKQELINYPNHITSITLISAVVGFFSFTAHPLLLILYLPLLLLPRISSLFQHTPLKVASFTATTLVFGLINGHMYSSLQAYLSGEVIEPPIFSIYLSLMTVYHYFQFQLINNFHHPTLCWQSFLIYHSKQYFMANLFSLTEHIVTLYLFDFSFKRQHCLMPVALSVSVVGELLRIAAFFTCRSNFTHVVKSRIDGAHRLITKGVYSFFRHPSYTGYFYFSVFGQIFIGNFISSVLFFFVLSRFFNDRIEFEEEALLRSFPEYLAYKGKTYILIPFVRDPDFAKKYSVAKEEEAELSDNQN